MREYNIAVIPGEYTGVALGVFNGDHIIVMTPEGRGAVPCPLAKRAYKVG